MSAPVQVVLNPGGEGSVWVSLSLSRRPEWRYFRLGQVELRTELNQ